MSALPRVAGTTRERLAREFDDRGPDVCVAEITLDLDANNPELLDMAMRCARDVGGADAARVMRGFCMFYRLLTAEAQAALTQARDAGGGAQWSLLPRVSRDTRAQIVKRIDAVGSKDFTNETIIDLENHNPELLLMAHNFAEAQRDYAGLMQGFALLYASLLAEALQQRGSLH